MLPCVNENNYLGLMQWLMLSLLASIGFFYCNVNFLMLIYMKAFFMSHDVIESSGSGGKLGMSTAACFLLPGPPTTFTSWP